MMKNKLFISIVLFLLVIGVAHAATVSIATESSILEGEDTVINLTLDANPAVNGSIILRYTNLESSVSSINIMDDDFNNDNRYSYAWEVTPKEEGDFSIYAEVRNSQGTVIATNNKTGTAEDAGPEVTKKSPTGLVSSSTIALKVTTNIDTTCKYDTSDGSYENLDDTFATTGGKNHSQTISGLSHGTYTYYVLCKDEDEQVMHTSEKVTFTVDNLPSAKVILKDPSPVKEGIIEVKVITSKDLPNAPLLEYSFNTNPGSKQKISLTGEGSEWTGYLVVTDADDNKVGTFYFQGVDAEENIGTRITNNNLFIVDTEKPTHPRSIKAVTEADGTIRLNWYYDGEEANYFNVYRTTTSGVRYVDFYGKANDTQFFFDRSVADKVTYYYKVSAVDLAGNEGGLSSEAFATSVSKIPGATTQTTTQPEVVEEAPRVLPPTLVPAVDAQIKVVNKVLLDVEDHIGDVNGKSPEEKELLAKFSVESKLKDAKTKLEGFVKQLEDLKKIYAEESDLEKKFKEIDQEIQKLRKTTPRAASLTEQTEVAQSTSKEDVQIAATEAMKDLGLSQEEIDEYIKINQRVRDDFNVNAQAEIITVEYMDGSTKQQTYIQKTMKYDKAEPLEDVLVIEIIPKKIAAHVSEISFVKQNFEVLNEDPVVKYGFLNFNYQGEEISYSVEKRIDLEEVKNAKSVVLLSPSTITQSSSSITGFAIFPINKLQLDGVNTLFVYVGLATIVGLLIYYFVFVKGHTGKRIRQGHMISRTKTFFENRKLGRKFRHHTHHMPKYELPEQPVRVQPQLQTVPTLRREPQQMPEQVYSNSPEHQGQSQFHHLQPISAGDEGHLRHLLDQAHIHLGRNEKAQAIQLYQHINRLYQDLPKEIKTLYIDECISLHKAMKGK